MAVGVGVGVGGGVGGNCITFVLGSGGLSDTNVQNRQALIN